MLEKVVTLSVFLDLLRKNNLTVILLVRVKFLLENMNTLLILLDLMEEVDIFIAILLVRGKNMLETINTLSTLLDLLEEMDTLTVILLDNE